MTNKKAIEKYIMDCINFDDVSLNTLSDDWKLAKVYHDFKMQMLPKRHDLKRPINEKKLFIDWLQGLPTDFDIEFRMFEQVELLQKWDVTYNPDRTDELYNTFYNIVTKVFYDLLKQYNIN